MNRIVSGIKATASAVLASAFINGARPTTFARAQTPSPAIRENPEQLRNIKLSCENEPNKILSTDNGVPIKDTDTIALLLSEVSTDPVKLNAWKDSLTPAGATLWENVQKANQACSPQWGVRTDITEQKGIPTSNLFGEPK